MPLVNVHDDGTYLDLDFHVTEPLDEQSKIGSLAYRWIWDNDARHSDAVLPKRFAPTIRRAIKKAMKIKSIPIGMNTMKASLRSSMTFTLLKRNPRHDQSNVQTG